MPAPKPHDVGDLDPLIPEPPYIPDPQSPEPSPAPAVSAARYSLRAVNSDFVCAEQGGGLHLMANRKNVGDWEGFLFADVGGAVTIQAQSGHFVCAEPSGVVMANRGHAGDWERWTIVDLGDERIALRSFHGAFLCAEFGGGGIVVANRANIGAWETFTRAPIEPLFVDGTPGSGANIGVGGSPGLETPPAPFMHPSVFEPGLYLRLHDDLTAAFGNDLNAARQHWRTHGILEGRRAATVLDPVYYLGQNTDLVATFRAGGFGSVISHWVNTGMRDGLRSSFEFDVAWYLLNHSDLGAAFGGLNYAAAVDHWLTYGLKEGRRSSADFDIGHYLRAHADLQAAFGANNYPAAFEHWLRNGKAEGRRPVA